jgi:large subunit ribosomal protein L20
MPSADITAIAVRAGVPFSEGVVANEAEVPAAVTKPTDGDTVAQIKAYLAANGVEFKAKATKKQLLRLV